MDKMETWTNPLWVLIGVGIKERQKKEPSLIYDISPEAKKKFSVFFQSSYSEIQKKHMKKQDDFLDRHKVAAITIASIIHAKLISNAEKSPDPNEEWIGLQRFALEIGLSDMLKRTNELLTERCSAKQITTYHMPVSFSNDRSYNESLSLLLHRTPPATPVEIRDLADRLFLIEYITLLHEAIDPSIFKEIPTS